MTSEGTLIWIKDSSARGALAGTIIEFGNSGLAALGVGG